MKKNKIKNKILLILSSAILIGCNGNIAPYSGQTIAGKIAQSSNNSTSSITVNEKGERIFNDPYLPSNSIKVEKVSAENFFFPDVEVPINENSKSPGYKIFKRKNFNTKASPFNELEESINEFSIGNNSYSFIDITKDGFNSLVLNVYESIIKEKDSSLFYDLRNEFKDIPVENQRSRNTCVSFSSASLIDYTVKKSKEETGISQQYLTWSVQESLEKKYIKEDGSNTEAIPLFYLMKNIAENNNFLNENNESAYKYSSISALNKNLITKEYLDKLDKDKILNSKSIDRAKYLLGEESTNKLLESPVAVKKVRVFPAYRKLDNLKSLIRNNIPIIIGSYIHLSKWSDKIIKQTPSDFKTNADGGHAFLLVGYIDIPDGKKIVFNENELRLQRDGEKLDKNFEDLNKDISDVINSWKSLDKEKKDKLEKRNFNTDGFFLVRNSYGKEKHIAGYGLIPYQWLMLTSGEAYFFLPSLSNEHTSYFGGIIDPENKKSTIIPKNRE